MPEEELVDIKFRLSDGSDLGPFRYSSAATVDVLKQRVVSDWPKGKTIVPKAANEVKLINSGKILENNKTVGQCRVPFGDFAGGDIIMHVVVQPSLAKTKAGQCQCLWFITCWTMLCFCFKWNLPFPLFGAVVGKGNREASVILGSNVGDECQTTSE